MKTKFTTENGSVYVIDPVAMTWMQIVSTDRSGVHRSKGGNLISIPEVTMGLSVWMEDDAVRPGFLRHVVQTSRVQKIEEIE